MERACESCLCTVECGGGNQDGCVGEERPYDRRNTTIPRPTATTVRTIEIAYGEMSASIVATNHASRALSVIVKQWQLLIRTKRSVIQRAGVGKISTIRFWGGVGAAHIKNLVTPLDPQARRTTEYCCTA